LSSGINQSLQLKQKRQSSVLMNKMHTQQENTHFTYMSYDKSRGTIIDNQFRVFLKAVTSMPYLIAEKADKHVNIFAPGRESRNQVLFFKSNA
jgi:hypothetical protein